MVAVFIATGFSILTIFNSSSASATGSVNSATTQLQLNLSKEPYRIAIASATNVEGQTVTKNAILNSTAGSGASMLGVIEDQLKVSFNTPNGYEVYVSMSSTSANQNLTNTTDNTKYLSPIGTGSMATPGNLATSNTWGIAVPSNYNSVFDASTSYSDANITTSTKFAPIPTYSHESKLFMRNDNTGAVDENGDTPVFPLSAIDTIPVFYGYNANTNLPTGTYTNKVLYTVIAEGAMTQDNKLVINPTQVNSLAGGQTLTIATDLYIPSNQTLDMGYVEVKVGNNNCTNVTRISEENTDAVTLTCTLPAQMINGAYTVTVFFDKYDKELALVNGLTYNDGVPSMQSLTISQCQTMASSSDLTVRDDRDGNEYTVRYLDDQCWMTQNLRTQGTITAELSNFTGPDFNINQYDLETDGASGGVCSGTNGEGFNHVCSRYNDNTEYGAYYNYTAATAGTIMGASNTTESTQDICPAGWRLPTNTELNTLVSAIGSAGTGFNPVYSGFYTGGLLTSTGSGGYGRWWSSTAIESFRYFLYNNSGDLTSSYGHRHYGMSVRCVKNVVMQDVASWGDTIAEGQTVTAIDTRDNNTYKVAKLDGNMWMTQNLRITGNIPAEGSNFSSPSTFNVSQYDLTDSTHCGGSDASVANPKGFANVCSHDSGNNINGVWYNFAAASAGTVASYESLTIVTSDICPTGWRLPTYGEQNRLVSNIGSAGNGFNPIYGGYYNGGSLSNASSQGSWWSSTADATHPKLRYLLLYSNGGLEADNNNRVVGRYVRCVQDNSMQNVASWQSNVAEGQTVETVDVRDGNKYTVARFNNQLWMTKNLVFRRSSLSPNDSNVNSGKNISWGDLTSGNSYDEARLHVGTDDSGNATVWYNYAGATAGAITSNNSNVTEAAEATESICPKGWRLPSHIENSALKVTLNASDNLKTLFNPGFGGNYYGGTLNSTSDYAGWWSSTYEPSYSYAFGNNNGNIVTSRFLTSFGFFVRCVAN